MRDRRARDVRHRDSRGGKSAAFANTPLETAELSSLDPQAWLTKVLGRIAGHKITKPDELMPWKYAQH